MNIEKILQVSRQYLDIAPRSAPFGGLRRSTNEFTRLQRSSLTLKNVSESDRTNSNWMAEQKPPGIRPRCQ